MTESSQRERINDFIHRYGESIRHFFRDQQRSSLLSPIFNLPGRLLLGSYCYYENLYSLLKKVCERAQPEEIASRMKRLCMRPNQMNLSSLMLGYFNGRQQAILLGTAPDDDPEEIEFILDFWSRTSTAYRNDGRLLPDEADFTLPILDAEPTAYLASLLRQDLSETERKRMRRAMATIDLFTFILNGESRIGIFYHGPYALPDGDQLIIKEQVGLQDDFYSWAGSQTRLPYPNIAHVMRIRNLNTKFVLMGVLKTEPAEYDHFVLAQAVFAVDGNNLQPLTLEELEAVASRSADAQMELYRQFLEWDDRRRIEYGAELYANILRVFGDIVGLSQDFHQEIRERFTESTARHIESLLGGEPPLVLQHIAQTDGEIYQPFRD